MSLRVEVEDSYGNTYEAEVCDHLTDDRNEDADGDGLTEAEEEDSYGSDDTNPNSDHSGFDDEEAISGTDPSDASEEPYFSQIAKVLATDGQGGDNLGHAVCIMWIP